MEFSSITLRFTFYSWVVNQLTKSPMGYVCLFVGQFGIFCPLGISDLISPVNQLLLAVKMNRCFLKLPKTRSDDEMTRVIHWHVMCKWPQRGRNLFEKNSKMWQMQRFLSRWHLLLLTAQAEYFWHSCSKPLLSSGQSQRSALCEVMLLIAECDWSMKTVGRAAAAWQDQQHC